jgi:predicted ATPase
MTGRAADAVQMITSGIATWRSTGSTVWIPLHLSYLARAYSELGQVDDAWRCIREATTSIATTNERWCEAEVNRTAGEIALKSPQPDEATAEAYFERALAVARDQQAKSWELRGDEHGPLVARSEQTATGPRSSHPGLSLVHRGIRYA